jgi:hypothetical protein
VLYSVSVVQRWCCTALVLYSVGVVQRWCCTALVPYLSGGPSRDLSQFGWISMSAGAGLAPRPGPAGNPAPLSATPLHPSLHVHAGSIADGMVRADFVLVSRVATR